MPRLIFEDPQSGQEVSVDIGPELSDVTIGRSPGNVVRINQPSVSREHAEIVYDDGQCTIRDLDSSNGSYINGTPVQNQVLRDGDRIQVGDFPLDYVEPWDEAEQAAGEGAGRVSDVASAGALGGERSAASGGGPPHTETARGTGSPAGFQPGEAEGDQPDFADGNSGQQQEVTSGPDGPKPIGSQPSGASSPPSTPQSEPQAEPSSAQEFQGSLDADAAVSSPHSEGGEADGWEQQEAGQLDEAALEGDELFEGEVIEDADIESLEEVSPEPELGGEEVAALREENAELRDRLERLGEERDELVEQLENRESRVEADESTADLRERIEELEADKRKKKEVFEELSADLRELVSEKSRLKKQLRKRDRELREMFDGDKGELREEYRRAVRERDELRDRVEELESYLEESSGGTPAEAQLQSRIEQLEAELNEREETLAEVIRERDRLEEKLADE